MLPRSGKNWTINPLLAIGIALFLLFGTLSLSLQDAHNIKNNAYAQEVDLGPFVNIGPPDRSRTLDAFSDGRIVYVAYEAQSIHLGLVLPGPGGRGEELQDAPANVIPGGSDPSIVVASGGQIYIVAERPGAGDIAFVECVGDDDNCEEPQDISTPPPEEDTTPPTLNVPEDITVQATSPDGAVVTFTVTAEDNVDGTATLDENNMLIQDDVGGDITISCDPPSGSTFPIGETVVQCTATDEAGNTATASFTVTVNPPPPPEGIEGEGSSDPNSCEDGIDNDDDGDIDFDDADCQFETGGLCSDGIDNDEDGETDSDDSDCFGGEPVSFNGNVPTEGVRPTPYPSVSPQIRFVTTSGVDDLALLDQRNEERDSALNLAEQIQQGEQREDQRQSGLNFNLDEQIQQGEQREDQREDQRGVDIDCPPAGTGAGSGSSIPSNAEIATSSDGSDIYIVWEQDGDIMFRASHDGGETFGEILNLSNNAGTSFNPRVATSSNGQFVHVTWEDNTPGNLEIFYSRSTDGGETFNGGSPVGTPTNLSSTPRASFDHQLVAEGTNVYVVWVDCTTDNGDIYFRESNNNGESFSDINNLSADNRFFHTSRDPDMAAQGSLVSVVWTVYGGAAGGIGEILFRESTNNGNSFGVFVLVSNTPGTDSKEPQVDYTPEDAERYVAWHDQGGPPRVNTPEGVYNVLAAASDNGVEFSPPVNLSDAPNNPDKQKQTSQLQIVDDVAVWDPSSRRG